MCVYTKHEIRISETPEIKYMYSTTRDIPSLNSRQYKLHKQIFIMRIFQLYSFKKGVC